MDFEALIKKHVGEDGSADVAKLATAIASAVGREFVDKKRYDAKLEEIETLRTEKETAEDSAKASAAWEGKYKTLDQQFKDYKTDVANKETLAAKKAAHRKLLADKKINEADIDLIMAATDYSGMNLDDKGNLADAESISKTIEEKYARYIPDIKSRGTDPANPPVGGNGGMDAGDIRAMTAKWHAAKYGEAKKE